MRFLIRTITDQDNSPSESHDSEFIGDVITLGRAADQVVQVVAADVAARHAVIRPRGKGSYQVKALSHKAIVVNDISVNKAIIKPGDNLMLGTNRLELIAPPPGFDMALVYRRKNENTPNPYNHYETNSAHSAPAKARWSWLLGLGFLGLGFLLPFAGTSVDWAQNGVVRSFLPSEKLWLTGPLQPAHQVPAVSDDCRVCHRTPFRSVSTAECGFCHKQVGHHADPETHPLPELQAACPSCHKEHNEPSAIERTRQSLCSDCHRDLAAQPDACTTAEKNASDFGSHHPEFQPTLISYADGKTQSRRVSLDKKPKEQSNLNFPHNKHLDKNGVRAPNGQRVLECSACHVPDAGGISMMPVDMETMCQECHPLTFDENAPNRRVPHGNAMEILENVKEYYRTRALEGGYLEDGAPEVVQKLRRPGRDSLSSEELKDVFDWSEQKWRSVAREMFEKTTCRICHQISKTREAPPVWEVLPVRIAAIWLPKAHFTHARHEATECTDCHPAQNSTASSDVLIPTITTCRECHSGQDATNKIATTCIDCHDFHLPDKGIMKISRKTALENLEKNGQRCK